jgi:ubiquinone/menaquinone biosynthesis C-methylase UbiE
MKGNEKEKIRDAVRQYYGRAAEQRVSCCECAPASPCCEESSTSLLSTYERFGYAPRDVLEFYGDKNIGQSCGNPLAIAGLKPGETVLDLGCGSGFDCYLAAKQVGENGHVIGIDMTPEVLNMASKNLSKWDFENVEFRLGEIEHLPVADNSVDVIISNCVINLSTDKLRVFKEVFRALKPGGRLSASDIIATAPLPEEIKNDINLHCSCIAGTENADVLTGMLRDVGFQDIRIKPKEDSRESIREWAPAKETADLVVSATIEAVKPH